MNFVTWFDMIILLFIIILGIKGIINGFIKEIFGLIGLIGGVLIASRNANFVGELISNHIYSLGNSALFFFGFLVTLIAFWLICLGLGAMFSKLLVFSGLKFIDRILGFFIGSVKIFLVFSIFFAIISNISVLSQKVEPYFKDSKAYPILLASGKFIMNMDINKAKQDIKNITNINILDTNDSKLDTNSSIKENNSTQKETE